MSGRFLIGCGRSQLATVAMPRGEFDEVFVITGTEGEVAIETPGHCPTKVTVNGVTTEYPLVPCEPLLFFSERRSFQDPPPP